MISSPGVNARQPMRFDFGSGAAANDWLKVDSVVEYDEVQGFGFDFGTSATFVNREIADPIDGDLAISDRPFYFSVRLAEGSYRVNFRMGDAKRPSNCTIKTESRQLMLDNIETEAGGFVTLSIAVHVRTPKLPDGGKVRLKGREIGRLQWDNKLTIEFNGPAVALCSLEIVPADDLTTVFLLGDSTVTDQPAEPWNSWGQMLTRFFGDQVAISNHAASGESIRSSLNAGRIEKVYSMLRPGDFVFAQFGHNDMKERASDALNTYKKNFENLVDGVRQRGGIPVLVTSMERKAGVKKPTLKRYPETVREVAREKGVALIDLHQMSIELYRAMGSQLGKLFQDGTHHNSFGSYELARCVAKGVFENVPELAKHLRPDFQPIDPARPDDFNKWRVPPSPNTDLTKPEGS